MYTGNAYWPHPTSNTSYFRRPSYYYPYSPGMLYPSYVNYNDMQYRAYHNSNYPAPAKNPLSKRIIGYYPAWASYSGYNVTDIDVSRLTHINYAFANIKDGKVVLGYPEIDEQNFEQLKAAKIKNPNLKTFISVGGGGSWSAGFSDAALTDESREVFANSAVHFIRQFGFDGVDIDWEYPVTGPNGRPEDKQNFTLFLQKIREKLSQASREDNKMYLLTGAFGADKTHLYSIEAKKVAQYLDWFNLMTYDYSGNWQNVSGHNAPLYPDPRDLVENDLTVASTVQYYMREGVPPSQIVIGIPFYGRGWTQCCPQHHGQYQYCYEIPKGSLGGGLYQFHVLKDYFINQNGYRRFWNNISKVPYLFNSQNGEFISYDDEESISHKMHFLKEKCLSGAMIWELSQDKNNMLLHTIYNAIMHQYV